MGMTVTSSPRSVVAEVSPSPQPSPSREREYWGTPSPSAVVGAGSNRLTEGEGTWGDEFRIDDLWGIVIDFWG